MVGEADGYVDFVIQLSAPSTRPVSVDWWTRTDSAYSSDFDHLPAFYAAKLVFAPGVTTQTVRVAIDDDTYVEGLEHFTLELGNASNATLGNNSIGAVIIDNDTLADSVTPANIKVQDVVVNENDHTAPFYVELDRAVNQAISVNYATRDLTAQAGSDYTAQNGTLGFAAGETLQAITVEIAPDDMTEGDEQFQLVLSNPTGPHVVLTDATATATIRDGQGPDYPNDDGTPETALNMITFSEYSINTQNPSYQFDDNTVDVIGMVVGDRAQPESPAVGANTSFSGPVYINFHNPVDYVTFDAGYFDNLGSTTIEYIGAGGQVLHSETNTGLGIINYEYRNIAGIASIHVVNTGVDGNGFTVDSVGFGDAIATDAAVSTVSMTTLSLEKPEGDTDTTLFEFTVERTGDLSQMANVGWAVTTTDLDSATAEDFIGGIYPTGVVSFAVNQSEQTFSVEVKGQPDCTLTRHSHWCGQRNGHYPG
jgi:hypothetical protein